MPTVEDSIKNLTGNRKKIYDHMENTWIREHYVPSLRVISRTLFIPFGTVLFHVRKLIELGLIYRVEGTDAVVLQGAITSIDYITWCNEAETANRKPGKPKKEPETTEA